MQQDLEEEKNKTVIQDLAEKVENHEANLKKKDVAIQDLEIMVKEHEGALEKKDFIIQTMEWYLAEIQTENDKILGVTLRTSSYCNLSFTPVNYSMFFSMYIAQQELQRFMLLDQHFRY